ncbi:MAG: tetratricopeptide repeat protein [Gallionella sp.]|nr:tetratricopeptide repeat protein [Gallionella sp.]
MDFDIIAHYPYFNPNLDTRWISNASLAWTVNTFGFEILWLRLGNVLIHAANTVVLFFLLRKLFRIVKTGSDNISLASASWLAFFAALIFALHPISVYGVAYLIQRSILMATFFSLLMLVTYLHGLMRGRLLWMIVAALFYFAAVFSKEHSISTPAVAIAMTLLICKPSLTLLKQITPYYVLCAMIAALITYSTSKVGVIASAYEPNGMGIVELSANRQGITSIPNAFLLSILTQVTLYFKYLFLWLIPNPAWMSVDMREPLAVAFLSWPHSLGLVGFIVYFCLTVWLLFKRGITGMLGFALLCPQLLFLTELTTVRAQEPFVLYRTYLWMPYLLACLPFIFIKLGNKRAFALLGIISVLLIPLSLNRLSTFSSPLSLWDDAEKLVRDKHRMPGVERIYTNRGHELGLAHRYQEAVSDFTTAISIYPNYDTFYSDRATAHYLLGHYREALHDYNNALRLNPQNPISLRGRALTYHAMGDEPAAQADFQQSCALGLCQPN